MTAALSTTRRSVALERRQLVWLLLLYLAQFDDVLTTSFGLRHGTVEGNVLLAGLIMGGGSGIVQFWVLKLLVTTAMCLTIILVTKFAEARPGRHGELLRTVAWRGNQVAVFALTVVAINNLVVALL
jgi:hypothetical protein